MEWTPIVFATFKILVLGTGMYYAVKWHYDQGRKKRDKERGRERGREQGTEQDREMDEAQEKRALLFAAAKVAAVFVMALLVLGLFTFFLARTVGLNLSYP